MALSPVLYFTRPMVATVSRREAFSCCLQIKNEHGHLLSLALDNSLGTAEIAWRGEIALYPDDMTAEPTITFPGPTPIDLLERLARHLGYRIERI